MKNPQSQMALDISLRDSISFDSFVAGHNAELVQHLINVAEGREVTAPLFIWGESGGGKSHQLNACFQLAEKENKRPWLVSLPELAESKGSEEILSGVEDFEIFILDGLDSVSGIGKWEEQLFKLCNMARDREKSVIFSAIQPPMHLGLCLRDLATRLMSGLTYQVLPLGDEQKIAALKDRASERGFELPEEAINHILSRYRRDTGNLFRILDLIDQASLEQKRLITVPFLRTLDLD